MGMKRHSGRPDTRMSEELDALILRTAARLFGEQGYAATSIEQIAAVAGVGKQTIYRRHPSKEALFRKVITELGSSFLTAAEPPADAVSTDPVLALRKAMRRLLDLVLAPETIALSRTFIGEGWRFPDLVEHAGAHFFDPLEQMISGLLKAVDRAGRLKSGYDLQETAEILSGLLLGRPHQQALFGRLALVTPQERDRYMDQGWKAVMTSLLKQPDATRPAGAEA